MRPDVLRQRSGLPLVGPSLQQMCDWTERLGALASEMEDAYGPCGERNPNVVDAATHVAFSVALRERDWMQSVHDGSAGVIFSEIPDA